jgi:hypothetical protein
MAKIEAVKPRAQNLVTGDGQNRSGGFRRAAAAPRQGQQPRQPAASPVKLLRSDPAARRPRPPP